MAIQQPLKKISLSTDMMDASQISSYLSSELEDSKTKIDAMMRAQNMTQQLVVMKDKVLYYYPEVYGDIMQEYANLSDALLSNNMFEGTIFVTEDITLSGNPLLFDRQLTVNLNNHTLSLDQPTFCNISSNASRDAELGHAPDVTIINGSIVTDVEGRKIVVYGGNLTFKNVQIYADCKDDRDIIPIRVNSSEDPDYLRKEIVTVDRNCVFTLDNANKSQSMFHDFSHYFRLLTTGKVTSYDEYLSKYGSLDVNPKFVLDGKFVINVTNYDQTIIESPTGEFEPIYDLPYLFTTNGSDKAESEVIVNENCYISMQRGHGLYAGNNMHITLNGGTIIGGTGIIMRGGTLTVPVNANPTVIGVGEYRPYDPCHSQRVYKMGSSTMIGSDAGNFLDLGHAILLESNGPSSYGGKMVSADIQSGSFISYNNTAIGCYGVAVKNAPPYFADEFYAKDESGIERLSTDFTIADMAGNLSTINEVFFVRQDEVLKNGQLNRTPSVIKYDYTNGHYSDYNVINSASESTMAVSIRQKITY